ncbi:MAG: hypothetical protein ACR2QX_03610 [Woeseiaceae bacterium]
MKYRKLLITGLTALSLSPSAHSQSEGRDFDLPAAEISETLADGGLELTDADFVGSPLQRFAEKWPDDLVIAPIPGRSPQVGWSLALAGGYFLESKDEDADHAPSLLGGIATI